MSKVRKTTLNNNLDQFFNDRHHYQSLIRINKLRESVLDLQKQGTIVAQDSVKEESLMENSKISYLSVGQKRYSSINQYQKDSNMRLANGPGQPQLPNIGIIKKNMARSMSRKRQEKTDYIDNRNQFMYHKLVQIEEQSAKKQSQIRLLSAKGQQNSYREIQKLIKLTSPGSQSKITNREAGLADMLQDTQRAKSGLDLSHVLEDPEREDNKAANRNSANTESREVSQKSVSEWRQDRKSSFGLQPNIQQVDPMKIKKQNYKFVRGQGDINNQYPQGKFNTGKSNLLKEQSKTDRDTLSMTPLPDIYEDERESVGFKNFSNQLQRQIQLSPRSKMVQEIEVLKQDISVETNIDIRVQMNIRFAKLRQRLKVLKQIDHNNNKFADKLLSTKGNLPQMTKLSQEFKKIKQYRKLASSFQSAPKTSMSVQKVMIDQPLTNMGSVDSNTKDAESIMAQYGGVEKVNVKSNDDLNVEVAPLVVEDDVVNFESGEMYGVDDPDLQEKLLERKIINDRLQKLKEQQRIIRKKCKKDPFIGSVKSSFGSALFMKASESQEFL